jgi:hypothetical protein
MEIYIVVPADLCGQPGEEDNAYVTELKTVMVLQGWEFVDFGEVYGVEGRDMVEVWFSKVQ